MGGGGGGGGGWCLEEVISLNGRKRGSRKYRSNMAIARKERRKKRKVHESVCTCVHENKNAGGGFFFIMDICSITHVIPRFVFVQNNQFLRPC